MTRQGTPLDSGINEARVHRIRRRLLRWGRRHFKQYPWRTETDPWLSFVAEFFLQRTRSRQVESVYLDFRERFPNAAALVDGGLPAVKEVTEHLGLHWRGPLLMDIAKTVVHRGGIPPENVEELCAMKGVGMYTAAAWLSLHRGKRAVIIDANVCRWLSRMTSLPYNRDPRHLRWVQELSERLTPRRVFRDYNYAVLDVTMNVCMPRWPNCESCPLRSDCNYGQQRVLASEQEKLAHSGIIS